MLGKTANGLFWMYRYLERAENTSRLVETGQRIALTRMGASDSEWRSVLQTAGVCDGFDMYHDAVTKEAAIDWMLRSRDNPSSVLSSLTGARQNARLVRTALTHEVWEAVNAAYMDATTLLARRVSERDLPEVMGQIRQRAALVRGATHGTMLRNDIYDFARIGTFLERADNTARILDVKYYVLLPSVTAVGSSIDNVQWETILRSVSAHGGFRMVYDNNFDPKDIARFLILDQRMPRSLRFCVRKIRDNLGYLVSGYGDRPPSWRMADHIERAFLSYDIDAIFSYGLHEFIRKQLTLLSDLGHQVEIDYRFYE
ncbi:alpha-E domain-containing protein [Ponticoccus sp. SC2-23]|uniref:alpha-E domain-containing protein n=1 Tax=Alexandriicola marinus TaxID=2081710 RepID=UPI000FDB1FD4|nr:alpha-E domain-containing protein [Alexandriicola marinus]MBM1221104.1 alpha-E domain-containing protein [Ponticoccus sp. SC6-9]MBM1225674.1 alpha-E domain-containing protein [Ponticoccus sp. SC6-15]MBM1227826.1 alpha-E domain-containing protein [Ponticoccus sp. SC6-38]MBM1234536.1 alpha-E domain-containing protein [Ponticoccus sp. SC6-45]MBM1238328.1 alpha-E domain-containing protein [Ponticoccus sp. SC6-49]MBM1243597.1 alpha-E domain-containing protein [Ponticoccus sp. SC2-64]MBM1248060